MNLRKVLSVNIFLNSWFVLFTIFTLISCKAQNNQTKKSMSTFDIVTFNKNKNNLNEYDFKLDNGVFVKQRKDSDEYYEVLETKDSYLNTINTYYFNGKLKSTVKDFPSNFFHGIYKEYDEQGKLIKEIDYDKGFNYTWEDLLKLLKEREIKIIDRNTTIRKDEGRWHVWYVDGLYVYNIFIDGKTGEILQDVKNEFEEGS